MITHYTLGFLFNPEKTRVVIMKKLRPSWQLGLLNGVGGHIEKGERPLHCMKREFKEEVDYIGYDKLDWKRYASLYSPKFYMNCYTAIGDLSYVKSKTPEKVSVMDIDDIKLKDNRFVENVPWLISMAIDFLEDGRPTSTTIHYK